MKTIHNNKLTIKCDECHTSVCSKRLPWKQFYEEIKILGWYYSKHLDRCPKHNDEAYNKWQEAQDAE